MATFLLHFAIGTVGSFVLFLIFFMLGEEEHTSMPFGVIVIGILCGICALYITPWFTLAILMLFAIAGSIEYIRDQESD